MTVGNLFCESCRTERPIATAGTALQVAIADERFLADGFPVVCMTDSWATLFERASAYDIEQAAIVEALERRRDGSTVDTGEHR